MDVLPATLGVCGVKQTHLKFQEPLARTQRGTVRLALEQTRGRRWAIVVHTQDYYDGASKKTVKGHVGAGEE